MKKLYPVTGACVLAFSAAAFADADSIEKLAADAYALSRESIKAAQLDNETVLSRIESIARYDKTVYLGNHVGLVQGNAVLMQHSGVPLLMHDCQMAVEAESGSKAQHDFVNTCLGALRTASGFNIAPVDHGRLSSLLARKKTLGG